MKLSGRSVDEAKAAKGEQKFAMLCVACHGADGKGNTAMGAPDLTNDIWLYGGSLRAIKESLIKGRNGYMPAFGSTLSAEQLDQVASYVLSLSMDEGLDAQKVAAGKEIFNGQAGGCHYCHTKEATGLESQGAANLTDAIWTVANVPGAADAEGRLDAVRYVIKNGIQRHMPAWADRLDDVQIKLLTVYVQSLGG